MTRTVTLEGTADDADSGLASVSVSLDGGHSYTDATVDSNGDWTFDWSPNLGNDYTGFPVRVRAADSAGNVTAASSTVIVDNLGPTPISLASASPQEGSHIDAPSSVNLQWLPSTDGSGVVDVYAVVDQITGTVPGQTSPVPGTSYDAAIDSEGTWYVHLLAVDSTGNRTVRHYGPWFAETGNVPGPLGTWQSSVRVDGYLDFANGEWDPSTELLGSDPRPGRAVSLYATWDSDDLFLAWQGPHWGPDGAGVIHLDTQTGGTATPYGGAGQTLPFEADFAVVSGPGTEQLFAWNGSAWQQVNDPGFAAVYGATTATEIRIPRASINATGVVRLLAVNLDDSGAARSVLPDVNPLGGPWTAAYSWPGLLQDIDPNAGQPDAHHARVTISSPDNLGQIPGPGSTLRYVFDVTNIDDSPLDAATLVASGSDGLRFESLAGWPPPGDAPTDDRWFIDLGTLQPNARLTLTITARVKQDIVNTDAVTVTAEVRAGVAPGEPDLASDTLSHAVDGHPPTVRIDLPAAGAALPSGLQTVSGSASDLRGGGVASVEVRIDDGPWIPATGTRSWTAQIDVPASGSFTLRARAFDIYGYAGEADPRVVAVDNEAPVASIDATPPVLGGSRVRLTGTAADPGGSVAR
ncbi:MAG: hypothetical protein H6649_05330 [Caldilineae bacterium]|nr:hypothetical protein [Caldilineae bacterium]